VAGQGPALLANFRVPQLPQVDRVADL
jgi:hypothetical protein